MKVLKTERGWDAHYILANRCIFRRNTLLEYKSIKIVISAVGRLIDIHSKGYPNIIKFIEVCRGRYYETMAFHSLVDDKRFKNVDIKQQINFDSKWTISKLDADDKANDMHETVVLEITKKLIEGNKF